MKKTLTTCCCFLQFFSCFSQENKKQQDSILRSNYIMTVDEKMNIRADVSSSLTGFNFLDKKTDKSVHLLPNERLKNRITVSYRKISIGFSFSPNTKPFNDDDDLKGPSKTIGIDFGYTSNKFTSNFMYNKTRGYYIFNTDDYRSVLNNANIEDRFLKKPNVTSLQIGVESSYYFNGNKYSIKFAKNQSEIQVKSAGSIIAYSQLLYSEFDGRNENFEMLPRFSNTSTNFRNLNKNYYAFLGLGYGYNYIITKNIYITGAFYPAIGGQLSLLRDKDNNTLSKNTDIVFAGFAELSGGYQYRKIYGGAYTKFGAFNNPFANNQLISGNIFIMGYIGYRFNAPKVVSNFFDKVENLIKKNIVVR